MLQSYTFSLIGDDLSSKKPDKERQYVLTSLSGNKLKLN